MGTYEYILPRQTATLPRHAATLFIYFYFNRAYIQYFIYNTRRVPLLISSLLPLGRGPGVPSRDSNSGLPYSKPARYCLSHAANWNDMFVFNFSEKHKEGKRGEKGREIEIERERWTRTKSIQEEYRTNRLSRTPILMISPKFGLLCTKRN